MKRLLMVAMLLLVTGCTGDPRGLISGKVTHGDAPVTRAMVILENQAAGQSINVSVDETGSFQAMYEGEEGIPPGTYQVAVRPDAFADASEPPPLVEAGANSASEASTEIPRKYQNPATSGISIDVVEGENPPLEIDLSK